MSPTDRDELRESIEEVVLAEARRWAAESTTGAGPYPLAPAVADAVLAVLPQYEQLGWICDRGLGPFLADEPTHNPADRPVYIEVVREAEG